MLQTLSIKNVALIKKLSIDFAEGFNVLLGETGAGKSIIIDSLNFVLGAKADKSLIRYGENEMRVDALFSSISEQNQQALSQLGYEDEEICLTRTLNLEGKSTVRINGMVASVSILKEVGAILVDSYSQHESVELLKVKNHIGMLDKFGGEEVAVQKEKLKSIFTEYHEILKKIKNLGGDEAERERTLSLLQYQVDEIEKAELQENEDVEIAEKLKFLNSAEKIYQAVSTCSDLLDSGAFSCLRGLSEASSALAPLSIFDNIDSCRQRLDSVRYELEDIVASLEDIKSSTDFDEREFDRLDRRNDLIRSLTKKYGGSVEKVFDFLNDTKNKINELSDSAFVLEKLEKEKLQAEKQLTCEADKLTVVRKKVADNIENKILQQLKQLGMKSSQFTVRIEKESITSNGQDAVEFEFSANKGQEVKSLAKTASGGELSRFMLGVKNIFSEIGGSQTLVFDEIDSGISGETGNIVGEKINNISKSSQIICITHLPQVACYADSMFFVKKIEKDNSTETQVDCVAEGDIVRCLAQMTVGDNVSSSALQQANEMRLKTGKNT